MSHCQLCHASIQSHEDSFCWSCWRALEQILGLNVQRLLTNMWSPEELSAIRGAIAQGIQARASTYAIDLSPLQHFAKEAEYTKK